MITWGATGRLTIFKKQSKVIPEGWVLPVEGDVFGLLKSQETNNYQMLVWL